MVEFCPFEGFLPKLKDESISDRVSPPYDVIDDREMNRLKGLRFNVARITLGGENGRYPKAASELEKWVREGAIVKDERESFYLYRQSFQLKGERFTRTGLVGLLHLEPYEKGIVLPHEETNPDVKEDRLNLLRATEAHLESILGLYKGEDVDIQKLLAGDCVELYRFEDDTGTLHTFSRVTDRAVADRMTTIMRKKKILIADGHHRYETALRYSMEDPADARRRWILATLVESADPGLLVFPTHRVLRGPAGFEETLVQTLAEDFELTQVDDPRELETCRKPGVRSMGLMLNDQSMYRCELKSRPSNDPLWDIDSYVFEELVRRKLLDSTGLGRSVKMSYNHDMSAISRKLSAGEFSATFILRAPSMEDIWKVTESGRLMPRKTTYFWPKIWSGFVFHLLGH